MKFKCTLLLSIFIVHNGIFKWFKCRKEEKKLSEKWITNFSSFSLNWDVFWRSQQISHLTHLHDRQIKIIQKMWFYFIFFCLEDRIKLVFVFCVWVHWICPDVAYRYTKKRLTFEYIGWRSVKCDQRTIFHCIF